MTTLNIRTYSVIALGAFATFFSINVSAASVSCDRLHTDGHTPTAQELTDCLDPSSNRTRGLRLNQEGTSPALAQQSPLASLNITFEFGSSALTADAKSQLRTLGEALNSTVLADDKFLIEGHTDSVGSRQYNQFLSERRAMVVKQYLVEHASVSASRLNAEGRGEQHLLDEKSPTSPTNRRVQIVNLQ
jgi:outer membrane protein OmpA-like peptidoglycan-associated protein